VRHTKAGAIRLTSIALAVGLAGCGIIGPDANPDLESFMGTAVVGDHGGPFSVGLEGDFREDGTLRAELSWTVIAPGGGRFGGQPPSLGLEFYRSCIGFQCDLETVEVGPSTQGSASIAATVHPASHYVVRVTKGSSCGGCEIRYRFEVSRPRGVVRLRPRSGCPAYFVDPVNPRVVDLQASPAVLRLRAGERVRVQVRGVGCSLTNYQVLGITVADPTVAEVQLDALGDSGDLVALRPGRTRVQAMVAQIDGSRLEAVLAHCETALDSCRPTSLALEVVR
jgi:hypothetical protein